MTREPTPRPAAKRPPARPKSRKKTSESHPQAAPLEMVRRELERMQPGLAPLLPERLTADRLVHVVLAALRSTPALLGCDRASLFRAVTACARLGLAPDGALGLAWLVPARGKVQLVPGSHGLLALARAAGDGGRVLAITAQAVHRNDRFDYAFGLSERLEHVPAAGDRGEITHFYAYLRLQDGTQGFEVMSRSELGPPRGEGPAAANGEAERGKRAVLQRLAPLLPLPAQKAAALAALHAEGRHAALDDWGEILVDPPMAEGSSAPEPPRASAAPGSRATRPRPERQPLPAPRLELVTAEPEAIDLSEAELAALLPPLHVLEILDAVAERDMPEDILESIVGRPLEDVAAEDTAEILRAIALWRPEGS